MNKRAAMPKSAQVGVLLLLFFLLCFAVPPAETNLLWRLPPYLAGLPALINDGVNYLLYEWFPVQVYDPEIEEYEQSPLLREITRAFSGGVLFFIEFIREIFIGGTKTIAALTSWDFVRKNEWAVWPALPWTVISAFAVIAAYRLSGARLALLVGFATVYIAVFGQWEPSMETLSLVLIAASVAIALGLYLGIAAYRHPALEKALLPFLNIAQTMPHFSFLVLIGALFGVGDHAGALATIVFAAPPMVRLTILGLQKVPAEVIEAGMMSGCTRRQLLYKVLLPTARRDLLIGVNQVIMQCLAMATIAAFIGAKGLGFNLLLALNGLRIGQALEIGICIVLMAIVLDRLSLAWANKQVDYFADSATFAARHKTALLLFAAFAAGALLAGIGALIFKEVNYLYLILHNKGVTTAHIWQAGVDWMVENWYQGLKAFNTGLIVNVLVPMKEAYLSMPVAATFLLFIGAAYIAGGWRPALIVAGFLLFIAGTEWWDRALITMYLASFSVLVASAIGITAGSLCARHDRASKTALILCDTFQTLPSFIYLIPVIMLFGVTDTSVLIAVIVYAIIPATRYTIEGLRSVPQSLQDAGTMSGVTPLQRWLKIEMPLAMPHIMLGVNQTLVFSLIMIMIAAFIGTDDLGQLILKALSDKHGIGNGLMLGLCVAFIGLAVDQIIQTWAKQQKQRLGIA